MFIKRLRFNLKGDIIYAKLLGVVSAICFVATILCLIYYPKAIIIPLTVQAIVLGLNDTRNDYLLAKFTAGDTGGVSWQIKALFVIATVVVFIISLFYPMEDKLVAMVSLLLSVLGLNLSKNASKVESLLKGVKHGD